MGFIRRYKKNDDDGALTFREAWVDAVDDEAGGGTGDSATDPVFFVVNHGLVGRQSTTKETPVANVAEGEALLAAFQTQCDEDGYLDIPEDEQSWVVAQIALKSAAAGERDKYLESKAKESITIYFAWRGIGTVDRSEIVAAEHGTGKLNIYCLSPDPAKAVAGIKTCLREDKLDFTKLSIGVAPAGDLSAIKLKHSPKGTGTFQL